MQFSPLICNSIHNVDWPRQIAVVHPHEQGEQIARDRKRVARVLRHIESTLKKSEFLCGDTVTIADLSAYGEIGQANKRYRALLAADLKPSNCVQVRTN